MKTYIIAALSTLGLLTTQTRADDCLYKEVPEIGKVYVTPVYKASVTYYFDKKVKDAYALVNWNFDEEKTKQCLSVGSVKFPGSQVVVPSTRMPELNVRVFGSEASSHLITPPYSDTAGQWSGYTDILYLTFSKRAEIEKSISMGEKLIQMEGEMRYRLTTFERRIVGTLNCTEKEEEAGVLNLFRRFGEIKKNIEQLDKSLGIDVEEVMQEFLGSCVVFQEVDADSLVGFESAQRKNSRIVSGRINYVGNARKDTTEAMPAILTQTAQILDL